MAHSRMFAVTVKGNEVVFKSPFTDEGAVETLQMLVESGKIRSTFASSLLSQKDHLSPKQLAWVHKLAIDSWSASWNASPVNASGNVAPFNAPSPPPKRFPNISRMFSQVSPRLVNPVITLNLEGMELQLKKLASDHVKYPDEIVLYVNTQFYGWITKDGEYHPFTTENSIVTQALAEMENNPVAYAVTYGKRTGCCCFCNRHLTTDASINMGYGPVCAKHYNLPY